MFAAQAIAHDMERGGVRKRSKKADTHHQSHQFNLRNDTAVNGEDEELPEQCEDVEQPASTHHEQPETIVPFTRLPPDSLYAGRCEVYRLGGRKNEGQEGRLINDGHKPDLTSAPLWLYVPYGLDLLKFFQPRLH